MSTRGWPLETRRRAIAMLKAGIAPAEVSVELGVPVDTVYHWRQRHTTHSRRRDAEPKSKSGSGVIAPEPYARGYVFPGGRGRGKRE